MNYYNPSALRTQEGTWTIKKSFFNDIERIIKDNKNSVEKATQGMDILVRMLILVVKANAQKRSLGPTSPTIRSVPALANRIPVQRITGDYYWGWQTKRKGTAHWSLFNDSREAYLIENGIFQRTRRPILKLSVIEMLRFVSGTKVADRFMAGVLAPRNKTGGPKQGFQTFVERLVTGQSTILSEGNPHMAGPKGRLPG